MVRPPTIAIAGRTIIVELALTLAVAACGDYRAEPTGPDVIPPSLVNVAFCSGSEPAWLAFQDGDGAWTRVLPSSAAQQVSFHLALKADRGAVATARNFAGGFTVLSIQYGAPSELALVGDFRPEQCGGGAKTLLGSVAGLDTNEIAIVSASHPVSTEVISGAEGTSFAFADLATGPQVILATRGTREIGDMIVNRFILRRNPDLPDGTTLPVIDFSSSEAFEPAVHSVRLAGLGSDAATTQTAFRTENGEGLVTFPRSATAETTRLYYAIPEERLATGELQSLTMASAPSANNVVRAVQVYFRSPTDRTLTLGALPSAPELSVASSGPAARPRARFATQSDYDRLTFVDYQQFPSTVVTVSMTATYAALIGGYDLLVPELTDVQGFDSRWALRSGENTLWTSLRLGGTLGLGANAVPSDGAMRRTGADAGFFIP